MHIPTGVASALAAFALMAGPVFAAEKTIELPSFTAVDISSGIDAEITVGPAQSIIAESPDAGILERMQIRVVGSELKAWFDWSIFDIFSLGIDRPVVLRITVPELVQAEASAGADVTVTGMTGDALDLEASSGAGLKATGIAGGSVSIQTSSGASVDAAGTCTSGSFEASSGADLNATGPPLRGRHRRSLERRSCRNLRQRVDQRRRVERRQYRRVGLPAHGRQQRKQRRRHRCLAVALNEFNLSIGGSHDREPQLRPARF